MILARLERHRLGNYAVTFGAGILQIVSAIVLSRVAFQQMDSAELRTWFLMMALWPFISLFELGANVVLPHRFASVDYDPVRASAVASDFITAVLIFILAGALVCAAAAQFAVSSTEGRSLIPLGVALFFAAAMRVGGNALQSMLYALGDNFFDKVLRIGATLALTVAGIAGLKSGLGLFSLPLAWACGALLSITLALIRQRQRWCLALSASRVSRAGAGSMLLMAMRYFGIAIPGQVVFNATPFIIAANLPAVYTISYGATQQLVAGISLLTSLPMTLATPTLARLHKEDVKFAGSALLRALFYGGVISLHCLLIVGLNQEEILNLWTGKPVPIETSFLALYFFMMFVEWQQSAMTTAAMATGNLKFVVVTTVSAAVVVTIMPAFINWFGFVGVPLAILLAQCATCHPHNIMLALRIYKLRFYQYLVMLRLPLLSALPIVIVYFVLRAQDGTGAWLLIASSCASLAILIGGYTFRRRTIEGQTQSLQQHSAPHVNTHHPLQENAKNLKA